MKRKMKFPVYLFAVIAIGLLFFVGCSDDETDAEPIESLYLLALEVNPQEAGSVTGAGEYQEGTQVNIDATSNEGWEFNNWTGDTDYVADPASPNTTVSMPSEDVSITASFEEEYTDTEVVEVFNPATGKVWMDRNLGASRAATSSTDAEAYGDLYQWGRAADGHQKRNSGTTSILSSHDTPGHGDFILALYSYSGDWRSPQNNYLWQGINGTNNPCPPGYRLPTHMELAAERWSWSSNDAAGAFASPLKWPLAGYRNPNDGSLSDVGSSGYYWSSGVYWDQSRSLIFRSTSASMGFGNRANGASVRCIKD